MDLTYSYTARGQIAGIDDQSPANIDQTFTYDGVGRLTASTGPWGAGTFSYDAIGNLLQRQVGARTVALSYNAANRLASHTDTAGVAPAPVTGTYAYDGHLRRAKQIVGGVTRYSVYDVSGGLVSIDQVGAGPTEYIRASGMTLARVAGAAVTWLHPDHLGSAVAGTGATGAVAWRESEQPFGEDWISAPANDNQAGYTGHVEDAATGLVYMQARYYDPVIGRFLANDPVGFTPNRPDMFNRYAYAGNDPVNNWDPDGWQTSRREQNERRNEYLRQRDGARNDFRRNFQDMKDDNTIGNDKFFHCKANCEATQRGPIGEKEAKNLSDLREVYGQLKGDPAKDSQDDQKANSAGRAGAKESPNASCSSICSDYIVPGMNDKYVDGEPIPEPEAATPPEPKSQKEEQQ